MSKIGGGGEPSGSVLHTACCLQSQGGEIEIPPGSPSLIFRNYRSGRGIRCRAFAYAFASDSAAMWRIR